MWAEIKIPILQKEPETFIVLVGDKVAYHGTKKAEADYYFAAYRAKSQDPKERIFGTPIRRIETRLTDHHSKGEQS